MEPHELEQLKEKLKSITQTQGGCQVRYLNTTILVHSRIIIGQILFPGDTEWSKGQWFKSGVWLTWGTNYEKTEHDHLFKLKMD